MNVFPLVDRNYAAVSVLEDTAELGDWMQTRDYLVICDEEIKPIGLVTTRDLVGLHERQLIDCDITKPVVINNQSLGEVYELMKSSHSAYLPVYDGEEFLGVISLWAIAERLLQLGTGCLRG